MMKYNYFLFFIVWEVTNSFSWNDSSLVLSKTFLKSDRRLQNVLFVKRDNENDDIPSSCLRRRSLFCQAIMIVGTTTSFATNSHALTAKNEALCATGFFTNIAQYRCTDIGDISDEGKSKNLSTNQEMATDSLLSKLDLSTDTATTNNVENPTENSKKSGNVSEVGSNESKK